MATFQQILDNLQRQRDMAAEGSPVASAIDRISSVMDKMQVGVNRLGGIISERRSQWAAEQKLGRSSDVQAQIKSLLSEKLRADNLEQDRQSRFMEMAETLVPQVTEEQLAAVKEQREAFREQQRTMQAELDIAEETAKVQRDAAKKVAAVQEQSIKDQYGTLSSIVGGLESQAQDPLSKFVVQGLGRFVKQKEGEEAKTVAETTEARTKKIEAEATVAKEDIKEASAVRAAREGVRDPGSAAELYKKRSEAIKTLATQGAGIETAIATGGDIESVAVSKKQGPAPTVVAESKGADILKDASPAVQRAVAGEYVQVEQAPRKAPENMVIRKAETQTTAPVTPAVKTAEVSRPTGGALGSKAGFANVSGTGKALAGLATSASSLAGSAVKFLGPWGMVANAVMSFDRMVPLVSSFSGAMMDLTKLTVPMMATAVVDGFASIAAVGNSLYELFDNSPLGSKRLQSDEFGVAIGAARTREAERRDELERKRKNNSRPGSATVDTTSTTGVRARFTRQETALTDPATASAISSGGMSGSTQGTGGQDAYDAYQRALAGQTAAIEKLAESYKNPGTTPQITSNPYMSQWSM